LAFSCAPQLPQNFLAGSTSVPQALHLWLVAMYAGPEAATTACDVCRLDPLDPLDLDPTSKTRVARNSAKNTAINEPKIISAIVSVVVAVVVTVALVVTVTGSGIEVVVEVTWLVWVTVE